MKKTNKRSVALIIILILLATGVLIFFLFKATDREYQQQTITPPMQNTIESTGCQLMINEKGNVNCFGCSSGKSGKAVCKNPSPEFKPYQRPEGLIGIPYSCYEGPTGCELAQ